MYLGVCRVLLERMAELGERFIDDIAALARLAHLIAYHTRRGCPCGSVAVEDLPDEPAVDCEGLGLRTG